MPPEALVVVGASAGGVEALRTLVARLPDDLAAAVLVVLHIPRQGPSALARILSRAGPLPATTATAGEPLRAAHIYAAPPDHHMLIVDTRIDLWHGPTENGHRPAIDPLFRSAAAEWGSRTIAVVLSGSRDDGTAGADDVVRLGGRLLVQDPHDALHSSMPRSALTHVKPDGVYPAADLGQAVAALVAALSAADAPPAVNNGDLAMADTGPDAMSLRPAGLACPDCNGSLFDIPGKPSPRYRCWVGHVWSPESLLDAQGVSFEKALWMALQSLDEKAELAHRMAATAHRRGSRWSASRFDAASREAKQAGRVIRDVIERLGALGTLADEPEHSG